MNQDLILAVVLVIVGVALFAAMVLFNNYQRKAVLKKRIQTYYGKTVEREYSTEEYEAITRFFRLKESDGFAIDDITWNDLDMDRVFQTVNHTWSSMGESYLYDMLRRPLQKSEELAYRESLISFMAANQKERETLALCFAEIGRSGRHSVFDSIRNLREYQPENMMEHILAILAITVSIGLIFVNPGVGGMLTFAFVAMNWIRYFGLKGRIEPYVVSCKCLIRMLDAADTLKKWNDIPELKKEVEAIQEIPEDFKQFKKTGRFVVSSCEMGGGLEKIVMDYVNATLHLNLIQFIRMVKEVKQREDRLYELTEHIGLIEASIAIASYRESLEDEWSRPVLHEAGREHGGLFLKTENIFHPLISNPVKNSISVNRGALVTGSNASGKSTFLKTIAVNALLAQTINTCMATSYEADFFRIYSSMALRDDLLSSESYYIVEIRSLKRILDASSGETPILCFVDEVLRGTNTIERIAASSEILKTIANGNLLCFAATHDMELTYILEQYFDNYHFQEEILDDDVLFNYQLFEGRAISRNAIKLLNMMGYPKEVTKAAEKRAENFIETGEWNAG